MVYGAREGSSMDSCDCTASRPAAAAVGSLSRKEAHPAPGFQKGLLLRWLRMVEINFGSSFVVLTCIRIFKFLAALYCAARPMSRRGATVVITMSRIFIGRLLPHARTHAQGRIVVSISGVWYAATVVKCRLQINLTT